MVNDWFTQCLRWWGRREDPIRDLFLVSRTFGCRKCRILLPNDREYSISRSGFVSPKQKQTCVNAVLVIFSRHFGIAWSIFFSCSSFQLKKECLEKMGWAYGTTSNKGWCISSCSLLPINWIGEQLVREPDATKVACWVRQAVKECFFYIPICMTENVYGSNPYSPNLFGKKKTKKLTNYELNSIGIWTPSGSWLR